MLVNLKLKNRYVIDYLIALLFLLWLVIVLLGILNQPIEQGVSVIFGKGANYIPKFNIKSKVKIEKKKIQTGNTSFYHFLEDADLEGAEFRLPLSFRFAQFDSNTSFRNSLFNSTANFNSAKFNTTNFRGTSFMMGTYFPGVIFKSYTNFILAQFMSKADFKEACFESGVDFIQARFESGVDFRNVRFDSAVSFYLTQFKGDSDFSGAKFRSYVDFSGASFYGLTSFRDAEFHAGFYGLASYDTHQFSAGLTKVVGSPQLFDSLDFRGVSVIGKDVDLTNCRRLTSQDNNFRCKIALYGSDIDKISISMKLFELWFPNETYEQKISVYEKVLKKLEKDGFKESYKILDIEFRKMKLKENVFLIPYMYFEEYWWDFGYSPERVFFWTFLVFIVFFALFALRFQGLFLVYKIEFLFVKKRPELEIKNLLKIRSESGRLNYYIALLLKISDEPEFARYVRHYVANIFFYTAIIFFGLKLDLEKFNQKLSTNSGEYYVLLTLLLSCYIAGLFCTAYIIHIIFK